MTQKHLDAVFETLPENLTEGELCVLTLTIHSAFLETPQEIITNLISTIYVYGASKGVPNSVISEGLRGTARIYDEEDEEHSMKRAH
jgi:hypothetical protein